MVSKKYYKATGTTVSGPRLKKRGGGCPQPQTTTLAALLGQRRRSKYRAQPTVVAGVRFASKAEARRHAELRLLERAGIVSQLRLQVWFPLVVSGTKVASYVADFVYLDSAGRQVVEDVKGFRTPTYRLKQKLMRAIHGIEIKEIK